MGRGPRWHRHQELHREGQRPLGLPESGHGITECDHPPSSAESMIRPQVLSFEALWEALSNANCRE